MKIEPYLKQYLKRDAFYKTCVSECKKSKRKRLLKAVRDSCHFRIYALKCAMDEIKAEVWRIICKK